MGPSKVQISQSSTRLQRIWGSIKEHPHRTTLVALSVLALSALLVTTFALNPTKGAMQHMWSKVGHAYSNNGALGWGVRAGTILLVGMGALGIYLHNRLRNQPAPKYQTEGAYNKNKNRWEKTQKYTIKAGSQEYDIQETHYWNTQEEKWKLDSVRSPVSDSIAISLTKQDELNIKHKLSGTVEKNILFVQKDGQWQPKEQELEI